MIRSFLLALATLPMPVMAQQYDPWSQVDFSRVQEIANRPLHQQSHALPAPSLDVPSVDLQTPPITTSAEPSHPGEAPHIYGHPTGRLDLLPGRKPVQEHLLPFAQRPLKRAPSVPLSAARLRIETAMKSPEYQDPDDLQPWGEEHDGWFAGIRRMTPLYAEVSIRDQTLTLYRNGKIDKVWKVSTGKSGHATTRGTFGVTFLSRNHKSSIYDNAPMPCSVFYNGNEALHGTDAVWNLGRPASHGCVRLETRNACELFDEVDRLGNSSLTVSVN